MMPSELEEFRALARNLPPARKGREFVHPRLCIFAATRTAGEIAEVRAEVAALPHEPSFLAAVRQADCDLRLYELDLDHPTGALGRAGAARTAAFGMTLIEPGPDLFVLASLGPLVVSELHTAETVRASGVDPLEVLALGCGRDTAAMFGAILATRMAGACVLLDGAAAATAACLAEALAPGASAHCLAIDGDANPKGCHGQEIVVPADGRPLFRAVSAIAALDSRVRA